MLGTRSTARCTLLGNIPPAFDFNPMQAGQVVVTPMLTLNIDVRELHGRMILHRNIITKLFVHETRAGTVERLKSPPNSNERKERINSSPQPWTS
jgi:hypothetical protein